jgi:hypothetical protein
MTIWTVSFRLDSWHIEVVEATRLLMVRHERGEHVAIATGVQDALDDDVEAAV